MRSLSTFNQAVRRGLLLTGVTAALFGAALFVTNLPARAASTNGFNCDNNAVIWCGAETTGTNSSASEVTTRYNNGDGHNSAASIHNIYGSSSFNITSSDVQSLSKNAQMGTVTKSGDIEIGGKIVATNALTAGRQNIAGSTKRSNGGTTFYTRPPNVSFLSNSLAAYVVMSNGQFKFAIMVSCGNPVSATPPPKPPKPTPPPAPKTPNYTINKEVAVKGSTSYAKSVTVKSGTHVVYRVTVASTGNAPVTNLDVKDTLPNDTQYVAGTLKQDGKPVTGTSFFSSGVTINSLANGSSTAFSFEAIIGSNDTVETCQAETLNNVGAMTATSLPAENSTATVNKTCLPKPVYACTSLSSFMNSRTDYTFTAKASASNGATIESYTFDFGDNSNKTVTTAAETTTAEHSYASTGTFNVTVSVLINVGDGTTKTVTSAGCTTSVTVTPPPAAAECTNLELQQDAANPRLVTATATDKTENGATLTGASFDWGDGATTPSTSATASHTYQADGTFTVAATLSFSAPSGTVPDSNCQAMITVTTVMPTCNQMTVDINNDDKSVTVSSLSFTANNGTYEFTNLDWGDSSPVVSASDITGQSHTYTSNGPFTIVATPHFMVNGVDTPITSASCQQQVSFTETPTPPPTPPTTPPVTPPTELVNTGVGSVAGLFVAAMVLGTISYHWFLNRRLNRVDDQI
jgi:uncharacterized repeat protein (TIGR01451 family)